MKNTFAKFFTPSLLAVSLLFATSCSDDDNQDDNTPVATAVTINDPVLRTYIEEALGLSAGATINTENILALDTLYIDGSVNFSYINLTDLTGVEAATNLVYFRIGETMVTDLSPVSGLRKVEYFRINDTQVSDLSPLSAWTSLTYFNANSATNVADITPLANNTGLQELILREAPIGNAGLTTISNFSSLYRLNVRGTGITDIQPLVDMMANGALLDSTPGAADAGGASLDLRGNTVDCTLLDPYRAQITNLEGC